VSAGKALFRRKRLKGERINQDRVEVTAKKGRVARWTHKRSDPLLGEPFLKVLKGKAKKGLGGIPVVEGLNDDSTTREASLLIHPEGGSLSRLLGEYIG